MTIHLHSCIVSFQRIELTEQTVASYYDTVSVPFTLVVVDNGSEPGTVKRLRDLQCHYDFDLLLLPENRFPGYATNRGWETMPDKTTHLHRNDNDFTFLPGWCEAMLQRFNAHKKIGQVGLRTDQEEQFAPWNVGGCNVIRKHLWDLGLRYDERPWGSDYPEGWTEDSLFSPAVRELGFNWTRVRQPCIVPIAVESANDPYYQRSWALRGIVPPQ